MESSSKFDISLGDDSDVPIELETLKFATARIQEIASITEALDNEKKNTLLFQRLPRHMRRRAMSHNPKRMPRNQREAYKQQLLKSSGGSSAKQKKPSRKHRRRPGNLLEEYNRRQRSFVWLETHIWHAKRFHMTERWGYRLAHFPNDRSYRACYRAAANHCLMQDLSFLVCIELRGPLSTLLSGLSEHTNPSVGLTFGAQSLLDGSREGEVMFYESGQYPLRPVGSVLFLWKPNRAVSSSDLRSLWIWAHPAFYQQIVDALVVSFQLDNPPILEPSEEIEGGKRPSNISFPSGKRLKLKSGEAKNVEVLKLATRNVPFERTPKYKSSSKAVEMVLLKDTLNRFRLVGPLSQQVLLEALQPVNVFDGSFANMKSGVLEQDSGSIASDEMANKVNKNLIDDDSEGRESHRSFWKLAQDVISPAELPPRMVLSLTVKDPRLSIPDKRTKAYPDKIETKSCVAASPPIPYASPLWSASIRDEVTKSKLSTAEFNSMRSKLLVPGILKRNEKYVAPDSAADSVFGSRVKAKVPLLLVQRPGSQDPSTKRLGFGCGWDVILPVGWAMPFWLAFNFRCARASGLREASAHELERGLCDFLPPDSVAGLEEESQKGKEQRELFFRLPPDKRPNFIKLGVACPFQSEWPSLIRDWTLLPIDMSSSQNQPELSHSRDSGSSFFVLRDTNILQELSKILSETWLMFQNQSKGFKHFKTRENKLPHLPTFPYQEQCLLPVRVEALHKGVTDDMSLICLPSPDDIVNIMKSSLENVLVEPSGDDKNHEKRLLLRKEHSKLLLRLRKQRVRRKKKLEEECDSVSNTPTQKKANLSPPTKDLVASFNKKMNDLWLLDTSAIGSVRNSGSRETAGFVTRGNFSFTEARGCGVGYITYMSLHKLLQVWYNHFLHADLSHVKGTGIVVMVRSPKSFQYRLAKLSIILHRK